MPFILHVLRIKTFYLFISVLFLFKKKKTLLNYLLDFLQRHFIKMKICVYKGNYFLLKH